MFGDCILTSASVVYGGVLVDEQQQQVLGDWKRVFGNDGGEELMFSRDFTLGKIL